MRAIVAIRRADANAALPLGAHARHPAHHPLCSFHFARAASPCNRIVGFNQPQALIVAIVAQFLDRWLNGASPCCGPGSGDRRRVVTPLAFGAACLASSGSDSAPSRLRSPS